MHPADEYAKLKEEIGRLVARADRLRAQFLDGAAPLRSNSHEVIVSHHPQRVFVKDLLPHDILADPRYWRENRAAVVRVRCRAAGAGPGGLAAAQARAPGA